MYTLTIDLMFNTPDERVWNM